MAWDHLSINKPHLVYIILGGFTSIFMLCSSIIKEKLYIGEATVATVCGLIFGPHAANLIDPDTWGNTDQITLEFSRIVLVVQCFAVGVELPRAYMERHWRSVTFLLIPVMTFGWLITSLFIWGLFYTRLDWLDSLTIAACVTATDPVLASSVVGKGKFAKRVPRHLRDLLSAESGCNDGMAFPFVYLAVYIIEYRHHPNEVALHWFCYTILYECLFGAIYGFLVGYFARRAIRYAHEKNLIDRESFLVFYFVLALFCAGSGALLGTDDLLVGFACGIGFSNDGWFTEKTEESHVSNVIDLLINLAFFVYFGTIIPWEQFNSDIIGTSAWKMVVLALLVLFFRRIPIMMALKPAIPDIKTWREALFAGHFGPIGVGAIFVAILARAELETESTTPLADLPEPGFEHLNIIELIWPITTFLVLTSILVHGSSIAVFTLGKHINTLTITMSYTQANEDNGNWMDRLPRIASRSKTSSMSIQKDESDESLEEKLSDYPPATLPRNFLRRQKSDDSSAPAKGSTRRRKTKAWKGAGGHIDPSAIAPLPRDEISPSLSRSGSETLAVQSEESPDSSEPRERHRPSSRDAPGKKPEEEIYQEGDETIIEDEEGNVLEVMSSKRDDTPKQRQDGEIKEARRLMQERHAEHDVAEDVPEDEQGQGGKKAVDGDTKKGAEDSEKSMRKMLSLGGMTSKLAQMNAKRKEDNIKGEMGANPEATARRNGPARAFRFGRTIIVEDEDGEVIKKYEIPALERNELERKQSYVDPEKTKLRMQKMGKMLGVNRGPNEDGEASSSARPGQGTRRMSRMFMGAQEDLTEGDDTIRFTMDGNDRRMNKEDFIRQIQGMNPKARAAVIEESNVPEKVKEEARADAAEHGDNKRRASASDKSKNSKLATAQNQNGGEDAALHKVTSREDRPQGPEGLSLVESRHQEIPYHSVSAAVQKRSAAAKGAGASESAAQRRRRIASEGEPARQLEAVDDDSDDDGTERVPPSVGGPSNPKGKLMSKSGGRGMEGETAAERRRREGALGLSKEDSDSEEDEGRPRQPPENAVPGNLDYDEDLPKSPFRSIRFSEPEPKSPGGRSVKWT